MDVRRRAVDFFTGVKPAWTRPEPPKRLILLSPGSLKVAISMGVLNFRIFSSLRMRADLNNFWWIWEPTRRTFKTKKMVCVCVFFWQKKKSEFTTEISFCEFGFFSAKKNAPIFFESSPCWLPGPPKIIQTGPHLSEEKNRFLALVLLVLERNETFVLCQTFVGHNGM